MNDEHRLHEAFQASRASERAEAPLFGRVVAGRAGGPPRRRRVVSGLLALGGALALLVLAIRTRGRAEPARDLELAREVMAWRSATDFLLPASMPGLFSPVPRLGEAPAGSPLRALDPGSALGPPVLPRSPRS